MNAAPEPTRITCLDDGSMLHGGPHSGVIYGRQPADGLRIVVDADGCSHSYTAGERWYPVRAPLSLYRAEQYGIADDPARPGVWRFWYEWRYAGELPPEAVEISSDARERLTWRNR